MTTETFVSYKSFRWLWIACTALLVSGYIYWLDDPIGGRNGGTLVGYALGVIATIAVVWLMAYGLRKRSYHSSLGTVEGWLSAHVWIGLGVLVLVPLHAGFSFGINVHTLAYGCMVITILSGIWGVANYATLTTKITSHHGGAKESAVVEQMHAISEELDRLCAGKSAEFLDIFNAYNFSFHPSLRALLKRNSIPAIDSKRVQQQMQGVSEQESADALTMIGLLDQRIDLARGLLEQARIKALLKVWLYIHVPCSVALCVTLAIHILSVFYFW